MFHGAGSLYKTFDIKVYGFFDVRLRVSKGFSLRSHAECGTSCNEEFVFFVIDIENVLMLASGFVLNQSYSLGSG